jgi:hypothetical protein
MKTRIKIDIGFYPIYKQYTWHLNNYGYVVTSITKNGKKTTLCLAHLVMGFDPSIDRKLTCDHKNKNPFDNREKNLRIVDREIQNKNRTCTSNTGVLGIHLDKKNKYYVVYYTINNIHDRKFFYFSVKSNKYQYDAWLEAKEFNTYIRTTESSYRISACLDDKVSSDGESVDEEVYLNKPNLERLRKTNTSEHKYISMDKTNKRWVLTYFDEYGEKNIKPFSFGPRSGNDQKTALDKIVKFKAKFEKYRPEKGFSKYDKCIKTNNYLTSSSSSETNDNKSNDSDENSNMEEIDRSSNSDTLTMSEDEIEEELVKIKNSTPVQSIYKGVDLDLTRNRYFVTYFDGYIHVRYFSFGPNEKYDHWMAARVNAEEFKDKMDNIM